MDKHYFHGYLEAVAHFGIRANGRTEFVIQQRADDLPLLEALQAFLGCGRAFVYHKNGGPWGPADPTRLRVRVKRNQRASQRRKRVPTARFYVSKRSEIVAKIIPYLDAHPFRSRKAAQYVLWREAALLRGSSSAEASRARELRTKLMDLRAFAPTQMQTVSGIWRADDRTW